MLLRVLVVLAALWTLGSCHNRLISPTPWNPNPTKGPPCGGGVSLTVPQAYWIIGSQAEIRWDVIGDGQGPLNISIDPTGQKSFTDLLVASTPSLAIGSNYFNFTVPAITCTGYNNTCSVQVFSEDGWVACTTVSIICANCTPPAIQGPSCVRANGFDFCTEFNDKNVLLDAGFNANALDLMANQSLAQYTYNMTTFANGTTPACQKAYKDYLCAYYFPSCNGVVQSCQSKCQSFKQTCGMVESHYGLYNCTALAPCPSSNKTIPIDKIIIYIGVAIVASILFAFIMRFVVCKRKSGYSAINN